VYGSKITSRDTNLKIPETQWCQGVRIFARDKHYICERALKKAILHRKNALFYKTPNGARVGDLFMSFIHTAELAGINTFDYLCALQLHAEKVNEDPAKWMPWNYQQTLQHIPTEAADHA